MLFTHFVNKMVKGTRQQQIYHTTNVEFTSVIYLRLVFFGLPWSPLVYIIPICLSCCGTEIAHLLYMATPLTSYYPHH